MAQVAVGGKGPVSPGGGDVGSLPKVLFASFSVGNTQYPLDVQAGIRYTRTLGMNPNYNTITMPVALAVPNISIGDVGTLELWSGAGERVTFANETVHELVLQDGRSLTVTLVDKRRAMNFSGFLVGHFNTPRDGVEFDTTGAPIGGILTNIDHPKKLEDLISLCFSAMEIKAPANLSILPETYPPVRWEFENPAREIDRLLALHGYTVTLFPDNVGSPAPGQPALGGTFSLVRFGQNHSAQISGFHAPSGSGFDSVESRQTASGIPNNTIVVGAQIIEQKSTLCSPVGLELDGSVKPLTQLSYYRDDGVNFYGSFGTTANHGPKSWTNVGIHANVIVPANHTLAEVQQAAGQSIWKWYQLDETDAAIGSTGLTNPDLMPVLNVIAETETPVPGGPTKRLEPYLHVGVYNSVTGQNDGPVGPIRVGFSIDHDRGIVQFDEPKVKKDTGGLVSIAAYVKLTWAYNRVTMQPPPDSRAMPTSEDFYTYPQYESINDVPLESEILKRPELVLYRKFNEATNVFDDMERADLDAAAVAFVNAHRWPFDLVPPGGQTDQGRVVGIVPFAPDGYFRQVSWSVGTSGADTTVVAHIEKSFDGEQLLSFNERVFRGKIAQKARNDGDSKGGRPQPWRPKGGRGGGTRSRGRELSAMETRALSAAVKASTLGSASFGAHQYVEYKGHDADRPDTVTIDARGTGATTGRYGITNDPIPVNGVGAVLSHGIATVNVDAAVAVGDRIGPGDPAADPPEDPVKGYTGRGSDLVIAKPTTTTALVDMQTASGGGIVGVVTGCLRAAAYTLLAVERLLTLPNTGDGTAIQAIAVQDAFVRSGMLVLLVPISDITNAPTTATHFAIPVYSADPQNMAPPPASCLTTCTPSCADSEDVCV